VDIFLSPESVVAGGSNTKATFILYQNAMQGATVVAGGDVGRLYDWMTNIFYSKTAGTNTVELSFTSQPVNCVGLAGVNWLSGGVECDFYTWNGSAWALQCNLTAGEDHKPVMRVFTQVETAKVKFVFTSTATLYVGEAAFGEALQMPSLPSIGLQPGEWSDDDEITASTTQSLNLGASTIERKGSTQAMQFNYISPDFMDGQFTQFRKIAKGRPVWCGWNQYDKQGAVIFGHWEASNPKFDTSYFTSVQLTIKGIA
jgi:hypothetical protein